jgi:hypothetical protein
MHRQNFLNEYTIISHHKLKKMDNYILLVRGVDPGTVLSSKEAVAGFMKQWAGWRTQLDRHETLVLSIQLENRAMAVAGKEMAIFNEPFKTDGKIIGGYLIIKAADMDQAIEIAKGCPALELDGSVEVRAFKNVFHGGAFIPAGQ